MTDTDYQPIDCALHDEYEIAIMHRRVLAIEWTDETGEVIAGKVLPLDIRVSNGEEFLVVRYVNAKESSEVLEIRLDRISLKSMSPRVSGGNE